MLYSIMRTEYAFALCSPFISSSSSFSSASVCPSSTEHREVSTPYYLLRGSISAVAPGIYLWRCFVLRRRSLLSEWARRLVSSHPSFTLFPHFSARLRPMSSSFFADLVPYSARHPDPVFCCFDARGHGCARLVCPMPCHAIPSSPSLPPPWLPRPAPEVCSIPISMSGGMDVWKGGWMD